MRVRGLLVGALVMLVAGCGNSTSPKTVSAADLSSMQASYEAANGITTVAAAAPMVIPSPSASQSMALLGALGAIDRGLNNDRSIDRARNACSDIQGGVAHDKVLANIHSRFEGGSVPSLSDAQAEQIITAITVSFCN